MEQFNFSDSEIRNELAKLGYVDVTSQRLMQFKMDLERLVSHERSKDTSQNTSLGTRSDLDTDYLDKGRELHIGETSRSYPTYKHVSTNPLLDTPSDVDLNEHASNDLLRCGRIDIPPLRDLSASNRSVTAATERHSALDDTTSDTGSYQRYVRRKTSRKTEDGSRFTDESVTESEPGDLGDLADRLREISVRPHRPISAQCSRAVTEPPYRLEPGHSRTPSVIYVHPDPPHTRNLRKSDPVAKFQKMRDDWSQFHIPGEGDHRELRWQVRELMVQRDALPKKAQRTYIPNQYIVPTDKKRTALRWQIRVDMAQGNIPLNATDE